MDALDWQENAHLGQLSTSLSPILPEIQGWGNPCLNIAWFKTYNARDLTILPLQKLLVCIQEPNAVTTDAKLHPRLSMMKAEQFIHFQLQIKVSHPKLLEFLLQENVNDGALSSALFRKIVPRPSGAPSKLRQAFADWTHLCEDVSVFTLTQICNAFMFNKLKISVRKITV